MSHTSAPAAYTTENARAIHYLRLVYLITNHPNDFAVPAWRRDAKHLANLLKRKLQADVSDPESLRVWGLGFLGHNTVDRQFLSISDRAAQRLSHPRTESPRRAQGSQRVSLADC